LAARSAGAKHWPLADCAAVAVGIIDSKTVATADVTIAQAMLCGQLIWRNIPHSLQGAFACCNS